MKDTYNLLADRMVKLMRALAQVEGISVGKWAKTRGYGRCLASRIKGEATIDWSDKRGAEGTAGRDWETRTGCWSWRVRRRGGWRRTERSVSG